ncbi:hypothetical protein SpCBS45565_g00258 [Spizellomyces sp. 'palustris']|nr:hypothetical protein SpCBS45565_g00258 [Spizellomyces sp. 'palustris']
MTTERSEKSQSNRKNGVACSSSAEKQKRKRIGDQGGRPAKSTPSRQTLAVNATESETFPKLCLSPEDKSKVLESNSHVTVDCKKSNFGKSKEAKKLRKSKRTVGHYRKPSPERSESYAASVRTRKGAPDPEEDDRPPSNTFTYKKNYQLHATFADTYAQGPFTTGERERIHRAVGLYLEEHAIPGEDLPLLITRRTKLTNTDGSPIENPYADKRYSKWMLQVHRAARINRTLSQLMIYLKRTYNATWDCQPEDRRQFKMEWTEEADDRLRALVLRGMKWADIDREVGLRDNASRLRWRRIMFGEKCSKDIRQRTWTKEEDEQLVTIVKEIMERDGIDDPLKFNQWSLVAAKFETRSATQLRWHWHKNIASLWRVESEEAGWTRNDDRELLSRMLALCDGAYDETEVDWNALKGEEWKIWPATKLKERWLRARARVPDLESYTFIETVRMALSLLPLLKSEDFKSEEFIEDSDCEDIGVELLPDTLESEEEDLDFSIVGRDLQDRVEGAANAKDQLNVELEFDRTCAIDSATGPDIEIYDQENCEAQDEELGDEHQPLRAIYADQDRATKRSNAEESRQKGELRHLQVPIEKKKKKSSSREKNQSQGIPKRKRLKKEDGGDALLQLDQAHAAALHGSETAEKRKSQHSDDEKRGKKMKRAQAKKETNRPNVQESLTAATSQQGNGSEKRAKKKKKQEKEQLNL